MTVVLIGCDNAGKSSLVKALAGQQVKPGGPDPTNGFQNATAQREGVALTLYDVGGGVNIRGIWKSYYADVHAAVFVVDAAAPERFAEAAKLLRDASQHEYLRGKPLLVLAHKQDQPHACSGAELAEAIRLFEIEGSGVTCQVGEGSLAPAEVGSAPSTITAKSELDASLDWLLGRVRDEYEALGERVRRQAAEQQEAERQQKEARKARLAAKRAAREAEEAAAREKEAATAAGAAAPAPTADISVGLPTPVPAAAAAAAPSVS